MQLVADFFCELILLMFSLKPEIKQLRFLLANIILKIIMPFNFLAPVSKGLLEKKNIPWLLSKSVQFFDAGILRGYMDLRASVPTSAKHYSTQMCEIPALKMVLCSDASLMESICIPSLYFLIHNFPTLKNAIILFLIYFI